MKTKEELSKERQEHLQWCKDRALKLLPDCFQALSSFYSDMCKNEQTSNHTGLPLSYELNFYGFLNSPEEVREHIEGFD